MAALGDLLLHEASLRDVLYTAGGRGGGVLVRRPDAALADIDRADFSTGPGLDAPRSLHATHLGGAPVLLAAGRYGTTLEAWEIGADGTLGMSRALTLQGAAPDALTALTEAVPGGAQVFLTAGRHEAGLGVWVPVNGRLVPVDQSLNTGFLEAGAVTALAVAGIGAATRVLALDAAGDALLNMALGADGRLGQPMRLDLRDGLYIDTPTRLEVVTLGGQAFALLGAAGSSTVTAIRLSADGRMTVTDQIGDTAQTRFAGLAVLDTLETPHAVYVLAGGRENGLSLMTLTPAGRLAHVASLHDEMRAMALEDPGGLEMAWRDGGIDIFVSGELPPGASAARRGVTQLRVEIGDDPLQVHPDDGARLKSGAPGPDLFVLSGTGSGGQVVMNFQAGIDRLDLTPMGRFYSLDDLSFASTANGAVIRLGGAQVTVFTQDRRPLRLEDLEISDLRDLWHMDVSPPSAAPLSLGGTDGPDLLDGREGADTLLGAPPDPLFDPLSGQVFRLYQATLDRAPDMGGLMGWTAALAAGTQSLTQVAGGFTNSREFQNAYGTTGNIGFVSLLYQNVLGRAADDAGLAFWVGQLGSGARSRSEVVLGFSESREFVQNTSVAALTVSRAAIEASFSDEVFRLYQGVLGREPDLDGFQYWTGRLAGGLPFGTAVTGFVASAEFRATYGETGHIGFVGLLYANVLGRAADPGGLAHWAGRLAAGTPRETVVEGFVQSREFVASTAPALRDWMLEQGTDDVLDGGGGRNVLMGGPLSDTFVFRAADNGRHVVVDAEPWDRLVFEGFGYGAPADVAAHLRAAGADTIFADQGVTIQFLDSSPVEILALGFDF